MKKTIIALMVLTTSVAGVCLAYNNVGNNPNPPSGINNGPNSMDNSDGNSDVNRDTNSVNQY